MKEEPYTPTKIVDSPIEASQQVMFTKPDYVLTASQHTVSVQVDPNLNIYIQKRDYERVVKFVIDLVKELQNTIGTMMEGDIITSYIDVIGDQLHGHTEIECHTAIIYHVIAEQLLPGGHLVVTQQAPDTNRPEQRQIAIIPSS